MTNNNLLQCYNRGCGQTFDPAQNKDDSCRHHPGGPFFHDAYKGWSCCNKKCTDFTEFLNIKGCTLSKHSNIKPPEPEKPCKETINIDEIIEVKPIKKKMKERPSFDTPLKKIIPDVAQSLKHQNLSNKCVKETLLKCGEISLGTSCKNNGCNRTYEGIETNEEICIYHPGVPIFHEGLKFWSCCQKRTTDFAVFLNQVGCENGKHLWIKDDNSKKVQCRWDYHQTASHVIVSIYAKQYCIERSFIQLNPIRLYANLVFPEQDTIFNLDIELQGIINVDASQVFMFGTKIEIKLKKAELENWTKLEIPRINENQKKEENITEITPKFDAVDLDDL